LCVGTRTGLQWPNSRERTRYGTVDKIECRLILQPIRLLSEMAFLDRGGNESHDPVIVVAAERVLDFFIVSEGSAEAVFDFLRKGAPALIARLLELCPKVRTDARRKDARLMGVFAFGNDSALGHVVPVPVFNCLTKRKRTACHCQA
jgi:hypothetical protein